MTTRRNVLKLLGLAPVAPAAAVEVLEAVASPAPVYSLSFSRGEISIDSEWRGDHVKCRIAERFFLEAQIVLRDVDAQGRGKPTLVHFLRSDPRGSIMI